MKWKWHLRDLSHACPSNKALLDWHLIAFGILKQELLYLVPSKSINRIHDLLLAYARHNLVECLRVGDLTQRWRTSASMHIDDYADLNHHGPPW